MSSEKILPAAAAILYTSLSDDGAACACTATFSGHFLLVHPGHILHGGSRSQRRAPHLQSAVYQATFPQWRSRKTSELAFPRASHQMLKYSSFSGTWRTRYRGATSSCSRSCRTTNSSVTPVVVGIGKIVPV